MDEAMLLHELLHIKYWDALQNSVWCICRALHWCNPLVLLAIDRAELDMESLCDQRVLERLEGKRGGLTGIRFWLWPMAAILAFRGPLPWPTAAEISAGALR